MAYKKTTVNKQLSEFKLIAESVLEKDANKNKKKVLTEAQKLAKENAKIKLTPELIDHLRRLEM
jgi:hypothetical protein